MKTGEAKVTIPREVADAIEYLHMYSNERIAYIYADLTYSGDTPRALRKIPFDTLMRALLDGYERELEPEEAVVVLYEGLRESERIANGMYGGDPYQYAFAARTVKRVLNALRIVIPGINDTEGGVA